MNIGDKPGVREIKVPVDPTGSLILEGFTVEIPSHIHSVDNKEVDINEFFKRK